MAQTLFNSSSQTLLRALSKNGKSAKMAKMAKMAKEVCRPVCWSSRGTNDLNCNFSSCTILGHHKEHFHVSFCRNSNFRIRCSARAAVRTADQFSGAAEELMIWIAIFQVVLSWGLTRNISTWAFAEIPILEFAAPPVPLDIPQLERLTTLKMVTVGIS